MLPSDALMEWNLLYKPKLCEGEKSDDSESQCDKKSCHESLAMDDWPNNGSNVLDMELWVIISQSLTVFCDFLDNCASYDMSIFNMSIWNFGNILSWMCLSICC